MNVLIVISKYRAVSH